MERRVKYSANEVVDDKFSSRPGGDFFRFPIPVYKHSLYPNSTEQDGKNRWVGTIPADEPAPDHDAVDATTLSGDALAQALVGPGAEEDPADTHLKHVAQMFFAAHTWIGGPDMPNSRALMWFVRVDPSFVPEAGVSGRGYVYGVELRNSRLKPARDNQYKLYILLCLMVELGAVEINPVSRRMYEARVRQDGGGVDIAWKGDWGCDAEDWDSRLLVDLAFKKIWNSVIEYYHSKEGQGSPTKFSCPLLFLNSNVEGVGEIQKSAVKEIDIAPWMAERHKYVLPEETPSTA
ncbi:hypothetical protein PMIN06_006663 [Paraphaeosphaeria minitans]